MDPDKNAAAASSRGFSTRETQSILKAFECFSSGSLLLNVKPTVSAIFIDFREAFGQAGINEAALRRRQGAAGVVKRPSPAQIKTPRESKRIWYVDGELP